MLKRIWDPAPSWKHSAILAYSDSITETNIVDTKYVIFMERFKEYYVYTI
jgi:hypothetical protein